jgi:hypothetical protein
MDRQAPKDEERQRQEEVLAAQEKASENSSSSRWRLIPEQLNRHVHPSILDNELGIAAAD